MTTSAATVVAAPTTTITNGDEMSKLCCGTFLNILREHLALL